MKKQTLLDLINLYRYRITFTRCLIDECDSYDDIIKLETLIAQLMKELKHLEMLREFQLNGVKVVIED